jgi:tetratricopeptide (TPR) repeat protein
LSAAVVARNDEAVLAETLASVRSWASEVAVVVDGSSDRTAETAKSLGARVLTIPWQRDDSAARNYLLARLTGHWVLWLEPGEQVVEKSWPGLRRLVDSGAADNTAYALMVQMPPAGPTGWLEQAAAVRLIPNRPEVRCEGRVGETLKPSIERAGLAVAMAPGRILRHIRCHDPGWKLGRAREILELAALESDAHVAPPARVLLATGEAAADLRDWPLARQAYSEVVRISPRGSLAMLQGYYGILASFEDQPGDCQRQLAVCLEALEVFPLDAQLLCAMGTYLQAQDRLDLAIRTFQIAIDYGRIELETWHPADIDQVAAVHLALAIQLKGEHDRARGVLDAALARCPGSKQVRRRLVELHIKLGRTEDAVAAVAELAGELSRQEPLLDAVRGACHAVRREWTSALAFLQSAYLAGCEDPICLRGLAVVLLSTGQVAAAQPVLRRWASVEPGNAEVRAYLDASRQPPDLEGNIDETVASDAWYRIDPATPRPDIASRSPPLFRPASSEKTESESRSAEKPA